MAKQAIPIDKELAYKKYAIQQSQAVMAPIVEKKSIEEQAIDTVTPRGASPAEIRAQAALDQRLNGTTNTFEKWEILVIVLGAFILFYIGLREDWLPL